MNILPHEIRIDYFRTRKQSNWLNSCPAGVRITHIPTNKFVEVDKHKIAHRNRDEAFKKLEIFIANNGNQNEFYIMNEEKS